jgi:hypothetical protein
VQDGEVFTRAALDAMVDPLYTSITNANVDPAAAIAGSKLAAAAVTDREIDYTAVRNNLIFWMLR